MSTPQPPYGSSDEPRDPRDENGRGDQTPPPSAPQPPQPAYGTTPPPSAPQPAYGAPQQPYGGQSQQPYGGQQAPYGAAPTGAPAYGQAPQSPQGGNGLGIASIVVGGVGLLLSFIGFGVILAIVGLVLGIIALVKKKGARMLALIGTIVSGLGVLIGIAVVIVGLVIGLASVQAVNDSLPTSGSIDSGDSGEADSDASAENNAFGDTFTYDDGIAVTVSAPEAYTPGEYSSGADQAASVVFTVTIENGTDANFEPMPYETATSGGVEASKVYDSDIENSPTTVVPAGQTITYRVVFSVADADQIVFQMSPSFDYDDVVFTS
ncbi:DUF4190 domain-containing protein [Frigoribacterium sp. RIT-PI-h]|uniref:DUF4190 domain-containing protein n=1 Tax=Frigoribacterium sp. RIT-PI-h TaxID=1690245 RepID=UPI0006B90921|nr:DUF4190 domain-containing protein [Frigoribacterium sp. RIT-PI-h]KPG80199.1 hypothetical protein AEQ27_12475 [Frigoribacterium sp. RIT-PI-h]